VVAKVLDVNRQGMTTAELARAVIVGSLTCALAYWVIVSFDGSVFRQHEYVTNRLIPISSLFLLPVIWQEESRRTTKLTQMRNWGLAWGILVAATVFSINPDAAFARLRLYYAVFLFGIALRLCLPTKAAALQILTKTVLLGFGLVHAAILLLVLMVWGQQDQVTGSSMRWIPYHSNIRHLGYHGMIAASCGLVIGMWGGRLRLLGYAVVLFSLFGLIYFGSRGAVMGWVISGIFAAIAFRRIGMGLLTIALLLMLSMYLSHEAGIIWKVSPFDGNVVQRFGSAESVVGSDGRLGIWKMALEAIAKQPLLGYGPDGYVTSRCCPSAYVQVHNFVLQILLESGIAGLFCIGLLMWSTLSSPLRSMVAAWKSGTLPHGVAAMASILVGIFAFSMVDGLIYHVVPLFMLAICLVLFSAQFASTLENKKTTR
jgi:O-antigen ligase